MILATLKPKRTTLPSSSLHEFMRAEAAKDERFLAKEIAKMKGKIAEA